MTETGEVDKDGDLQLIDPPSISTKIEGIAPENLEWVKLIVITLNFKYCVGWSKPICVPFKSGMSPYEAGIQLIENFLSEETKKLFSSPQDLLLDKMRCNAMKSRVIANR